MIKGFVAVLLLLFFINANAFQVATVNVFQVWLEAPCGSQLADKEIKQFMSQSYIKRLQSLIKKAEASNQPKNSVKAEILFQEYRHKTRPMAHVLKKVQDKFDARLRKVVKKIATGKYDMVIPVADNSYQKIYPSITLLATSKKVTDIIKQVIQGMKAMPVD